MHPSAAASAVCSLKPIAWDMETKNYEPVSYAGNIIILNRANTDLNNQTITSQEQAILNHENESWFIEDRSSLHTTLLQIREKTKIDDGDIIVLGNRMFEFKG